MRAAASAASVPAWPPPITITSKREGKSTTHLVPVEKWGGFYREKRKAGKYRHLADPKEPFCTKNSQLSSRTQSDRLIRIKRMNFYKALFLCLLMLQPFSVDRWLQPCASNASVAV
jgi:hypothetical protein